MQGLGCPEPGLGFSASGAASNVATGASVGSVVPGIGTGIGAAAGGVVSALQAVGSFLNVFGSKGSFRTGAKVRIDNYFAQAMAGDAEGEARLRCYAGEETPLMVQLALKGAAIDGNDDPQCNGIRGRPGQGRAAGSDEGYRYAQLKLAELTARRLAGQVGGTLIGQSDIPSTIGGTIQRAATSPVVLLGAAALVGFFLLRRKGR